LILQAMAKEDQVEQAAQIIDISDRQGATLDGAARVRL